MIYKYRYLYMREPRALPKLMLSIDWLNTDMIREARRMLKLCAPAVGDSCTAAQTTHGSPFIRYVCTWSELFTNFTLLSEGVEGEGEGERGREGRGG